MRSPFNRGAAFHLPGLASWSKKYPPIAAPNIIGGEGLGRTPRAVFSVSLFARPRGILKKRGTVDPDTILEEAEWIPEVDKEEIRRLMREWSGPGKGFALLIQPPTDTEEGMVIFQRAIKDE